MVKQKKLDQNWQFRALEYCGDKLDGDSYVNHLKEWMFASVPGTVQCDLLNNKKIEDPYYRDNERSLLWIEFVRWEYRTVFTLDEQNMESDRIKIVFEGLDTFASIYLNDNLISKTENMFVSHDFEVKKFLQCGENELRVIFDSATNAANISEQRHGHLPGSYDVQGKVYIRKAQYSYGWDWGPRVSAIGIWQPVYIEFSSTAHIDCVFFKPVNITPERAVFNIEVAMERYKNLDIEVKTTLFCQEQSHCQERAVVNKGSINNLSFQFSIQNPSLWWPNGYGDQFLYNLKVELFHEKTIIDEYRDKIGIRSVSLQQVEDDEGVTFTILVNNQPVYCKGANWIPVDTLIPRFGENNYRKLLQMAADSHMTMLRVWGGGIYEQEVFYRTCDELGILVWQDFMFACAAYPEHDLFIKNIKDEAEKVVLKLRNYACIALWCGNNENDWLFGYSQQKKVDHFFGESIYHQILPEVCDRMDGTRPYWPSSPYGGDFPNDENAGDKHNWAVWSNWQDYRTYADDKSRFMSEFGVQAMANYQTWLQFTAAEDRRPKSTIMEHFQRQINGTARIFSYLADIYKITTQFHEFIYLTQLLQAEAIKYGVEHWRMRKFKNSGVLIWQFNDCWPACSWSMIDYHLQPKAVFYYSKKFFAPSLIAFKKIEKNLEIWAVNDSFEHSSGEIFLRCLNLEGKIINESKQQLEIPPNCSKKLVSSIQLDEVKKNLHFYHAEWIENGILLAQNLYFMKKFRFINFPEPKITLKWQHMENRQVHITISSDVVVKNLYLYHPLEVLNFENNYFDVLPDRPVKVIVSSEKRRTDVDIKRLKWFYL